MRARSTRSVIERSEVENRRYLDREVSSDGYRNNYEEVAGQEVHSSRGMEHAVGHREKLKQKTGDSWTGRSSDGYRNNFSGRRNDENE